MSCRTTYPLRAIFLTSTLLLFVAACGSKNEMPPPVATSTPTPVGTQTGTPDSINLERYAKITAFPADQLNDNYWEHFEGMNVADGSLGNAGTNGDGNSAGVIWKVEDGIDGAWVKFSWNSKVVIRSIEIWDNPTIDQQIKGGEISFSDTSINDISFGAVPDNGEATSGLRIAVPLASQKPVDWMKLAVTSSKGVDAGIAEIVIAGYRVEAAITEQNIAPYMWRPNKAGDPPPSVFGATVSNNDNGRYRMARVKDENPEVEWRSKGLGAESTITLEADKRFSITRVVLRDLPISSANCRFTKALIKFPHLDGVEAEIVNKTVSMREVDTDLTDRGIVTDRIRIDLDQVTPGTGENPNNCGLSEVKIFGSYTP